MGIARQVTLGALCVGAGVALAAGGAVPVFTDVSPLGVAAVQQVAVHPLDGRRIIALQGGRVAVSRDAGTTWSESVAPDYRYFIERLYVHPGRPGVVFMQESASRRAGLSIFHFGGRLYRSTDFGETWSRETDGYLKDGDFVLSPFGADPAFPEHVFATQRTPAIFGIAGFGFIPPTNVSLLESRDGGKSWTEPFLSLPVLSKAGMRNIDPPTPAAPTRLFLATDDIGAFVSVNSGRTWGAFEIAGGGRLGWIRQDPRDPEVLYAMGGVTATSGHASILRSDNAGRSWRSIFQVENRDRYDYYGVEPRLTIDPGKTDRLWLTGLEAGVFLSEDGGGSWISIGFLPDLDTCTNCTGFSGWTLVNVLVPSPTDSSQVYLIWKGRLYRGTLAPRKRVAVEYQYGDRFWITGDPGEAVSQDYRANEAVRSGQRFGLWSPLTAPAGAVAICRFQGNPVYGQHSRFIALADFECNGLKHNPAFVLEGEGEYLAMPPATSDDCDAGLVPVRRFYNGQDNVNHRYVVDAEIAQEMRARGWYDEGIRMCARPLGADE